MKSGMLPVGDSNHDLLFHVIHDVTPFLWFLRRFGWNLVISSHGVKVNLIKHQTNQGLEVSRFNIGSDSSGVDPVQVVNNVVNHLPASFPKLQAIHCPEESSIV